MIKCDKCGKCCRNLDKSEIYKDLHNGNGICRYLKDNLCTIYENRPLLCRVDEGYDKYFKNIYTREEYYKLNEESCLELKNSKK